MLGAMRSEVTTIHTGGRPTVADITDEAAAFVSGLGDGLLHVFVPHATAGLAIGSPILFSSVAHGSGHDIVGKGVADPKAMIEAISRLARAKPASQAA